MVNDSSGVLPGAFRAPDELSLRHLTGRLVREFPQVARRLSALLNDFSDLDEVTPERVAKASDEIRRHVPAAVPFVEDLFAALVAAKRPVVPNL